MLVEYDLFPGYWRDVAAVWRSRNVPFVLVIMIDYSSSVMVVYGGAGS